MSSLAAVLIAATATLTGFAIEVGSGHGELGAVFALSYAVGCLAAVLLVRQSSVFTAVIQPPLLLFVAVPLSYFLMHRSEFSGLKGFLITCGYPLIERFPLMLFTSAAVLVIGMSRWYFATANPAERKVAAAPDASSPGLIAGLVARWSESRRARHSIDRAARAPRSERREPARSRHARPERADDQSRRQPTRRPSRAAGPSERRRQRPVREAEWAPESRRRAPRERRDRDPHPVRSRRGGGYERPEAYPPYPPYDPYPQYQPRPPRQQPAPRGANSHHPVSRVRYRGTDPGYPDYPPPRGR